MYHVIPQFEILKARHEIGFCLAMCELIDRVGKDTERKHVRQHHAEDRRDHHVDAADRRGGLAETETHEHQGTEKKARLELKRMAEGVEEVGRAKTFADRGNASSRFGLLLFYLSQGPAHRSAECLSRRGAAADDRRPDAAAPSGKKRSQDCPGHGRRGPEFP